MSINLEYTITALDETATQYAPVQVRAVNSNGDETWSRTEVGTPALPAPTIGSVRADDRALLISWSAPTGITSKVEAYDVRYIETSADEAVDANWTDGGGCLGGRRRRGLTYAITGLTNGTEYDVQVRAVDEDDVNGTWSATTSATPEDHGDNRADATSITTDARIWGAIDPTDDEDYFSFSVSGTADFWIYTLGDLDSVAELQDSNGLYVESSALRGSAAQPDNFFLWRKLQSGTILPDIHAILGVFRLKGQPKRDSGIIVRYCKASQSPVYSNKRYVCSRRPPFLSVFIVLMSPASGVKAHVKTWRLPGALSPSWQDRGCILPQLGAGDNRPIRSNTPWNNRRGTDISDN